jgi:outer membrane protein assembly factor BamB
MRRGTSEGNRRTGKGAGWLLGWALLAGLLAPAAARADDWPQWLGPKRDGVWRETGILKTFPKGGPTVRWRAPVGQGYSGPAVAGGKVYLNDFVLDKGVKAPASGFGQVELKGKERVLCFDQAKGKPVWKREYPCTYEVSYPAGPRATPLVAGGKVYSLGTMGDLRCNDAGKGKLLWQKNFHQEYDAPVPMWGFAASPLLVGNKLICLVGGEGSLVVAFNKDTGREIWKALKPSDNLGLGYCPPTLIHAGGKDQLIVWHPRALVSLNPADGKVYWSEKSNAKSGMTIPTPVKAGDLLLVTCFYNGSMMMKLAKDKPRATVLWRGKNFLRPRPGSEMPQGSDGLQAVMDTPVVKDGYIYGVCSYGELRCLKAATGERVWSTLKATTKGDKPLRWANAFLVPNGDRYFLFNERGDLIIAKLTPKGYEEISRAHILDPTNTMAGFGGNRRLVLWSYPAFAGKAMFARNDKELVCVSLAAEKGN